MASTTFKDRPKKEVRAERVDTDPLGGGVLQVFVKVTQVKKNDPNTSNAKPEPAVLP